MILIDVHEDNVTKKAKNTDLTAHFQRMGVAVEPASLPYNDAFFEGKGPKGTIGVGIERKRLHDMMDCIDTNRFNMQRAGMKMMNAVSILIVEGHWKPHENGLLMEGFSGGMSFGFFGGRGRHQMYAKLRRYLFSVSLAGVIVCYTRDPFHTAYDINEWYQYFQKDWDKHTALMEMQKVAIPTLTDVKPPLVRRWARDLDGIGDKLSAEAARVFKTPIALATADEQRWLRVPGVGVKQAQKIVKAVQGWK